MSTIPPNIIGPIAQSGVQQQQASRVLDQEREQHSRAAEIGNRNSQRSAEAIGEADNDTQVHPDTEGMGSQGRQHSEEHPEPHDEPAAENSTGIRRDSDGKIHIDLEA